MLTPRPSRSIDNRIERLGSSALRAGARIIAIAAILLFVSLDMRGARADEWADCPIQTGGAPTGSQGPSCSLDDIGNALEGVYNGFTNGDCAAACDDPVTCALAIFLMTAVGGMGSQSQGFCNDVGQITQGLKSVADLAGKANSLTQTLNNYAPGLANDFSQALGAAISSGATLSAILTPFTCACDITASIGNLFNDIGNCVGSFLCSLQNDLTWLGFSPCSTSPTIQWEPCSDMGCSPAGSDGCPIVCNAAKSVCFQPCGEVVGACACPPPMSLHPTGPDNPTGGVYQTLSCSCPSGTHPPPNAGPGNTVCICNNGAGVARPQNSQYGMCPILTGEICPPGQTNYGGKCYATCPAGQAPMANGACCTPSQASACGQCCPQGEKPDPATGGCVSATAGPSIPIPSPPRERL